MTAITVDVTITGTNPLTAEYKSSTNGVSTDGNIEIPPGENATITFVPVQTNPPIPNWSFQSQWVTITPMGEAPPGPTPGPNQSPTAVVVDDDDTNKSGEDYQYEYTLYTTLGQLDPRIINKTGSG